MLNMSASYAPPDSENDYGQPVAGTAVTLSGIYYESTLATSVGSQGEQPRDDATLFFDAENSMPSGQSFVNNGLVTVGGIVYLIRQAKPFYNPMTGALHHWELGLVGN